MCFESTRGKFIYSINFTILKLIYPITRKIRKLEKIVSGKRMAYAGICMFKEARNA
jgi:hypothetical protein